MKSEIEIYYQTALVTRFISRCISHLRFTLNKHQNSKRFTVFNSVCKTLRYCAVHRRLFCVTAELQCAPELIKCDGQQVVHGRQVMRNINLSKLQATFVYL